MPARHKDNRRQSAGRMRLPSPLIAAVPPGAGKVPSNPMRLLRQLLRPFQSRRAAEAEGDLRDWYAACDETLQACLRSLGDAQLPRGEIGVVLDRIDRTLFRLRDTGSGAQGYLRGTSPELGRRLRQVSEGLVELRNETVRYLIRAQGSTPSYLARGSGADGARDSFEQAQAEIGRPARQRALDLERDLRQVWADLQPILLDLARVGSGS